MSAPGADTGAQGDAPPGWLARAAAVALATVAAAALAGSAAPRARAADPAPLRLPRDAALTPEGRTVIFTYAGDLWMAPVEAALVGLATPVRLTAHPAHDGGAVVSPLSSEDRPLLAFASAREGARGTDVYLLEHGRRLERLTFDSADDAPLAFSPDGRFLYLRSTREPGYPSAARVYAITVAAPGEPELVLDAPAVEYCPLAAPASAPLPGPGRAPRHRPAVVSYGGAAWWLKGHKGSAASELWLDAHGGEPRRLTDDRTRDRWPVARADDPRALYWVSGRSGTDNLWARALAGGAGEAPEPAPARALTAFEGDGVRRPAVAARAARIVFEQGDGLYLCDLADPPALGGGPPRRLGFAEPAERSEDAIARRRVRAASELEPNAKGDALAVVAHGEVLVRRLDDGVWVRVTASPAREQHLAWSRDGAALYFASDEGGLPALVRARAAPGEDARLHRALAHLREPLLAGRDADGRPASATRPVVSPDGARLAFVVGAGDLALLDLDVPAAEPVVLLRGFSAPEVAWSPDSRWLAITREDDDFNPDVWLYELASGRLENVSAHPDRDGSPAWSPDGRKLAFVTRRAGREPALCLVDLRREDHERTAEDRADLREDQKAKEPKKGGEGEGQGKGAAPPARERTAEPLRVEVDPDAWRRVRRLSPTPGAEDWVAFSADSERLLFRAVSGDARPERDLWSIDLEGKDLKRLTTGQDPQSPLAHASSKAIFFLKGGAVPAKVGEQGGAVTSWALDLEVAHPVALERAQVFDEAWRTMRERWYDATFKGFDWDAARARYRDLAITRQSHEEHQDVLRMMLGELRGSHLGVGGGDPGTRGDAPAAPTTGRLGLRLRPEPEGWVIEDVLPEGPCDRAGIRLAAGDRVLAVDGAPLDLGARLAPLLAGKAGERVVLTVARAAEPVQPGAPPTGERVVVRAAEDGEVRALAYERFAQSARALVERRSAGRLGYIHIRGMDQPSLDRFEAELYARAAGREGLVIDVRNNGGGWTADHLLAILHAPEHAVTVPRGGGPGYPQDRRPLAAWTKPVIVLVNERSFSNAEIFAHAMKTTGRGLLVGRETAGGVISTGAHALLDGARLRVPFRGWYVAGSGADMESEGARPDIAIDQPPGAAPRDLQCEAAVDALLQRLPH